jgi:hypothetical protein
MMVAPAAPAVLADWRSTHISGQRDAVRQSLLASRPARHLAVGRLGLPKHPTCSPLGDRQPALQLINASPSPRSFQKFSWGQRARSILQGIPVALFLQDELIASD